MAGVSHEAEEGRGMTIEDRLQKIEEQQARIITLLERQLPAPTPMSGNAARLIDLARRDPEAAKAMAKAMAKVDRRKKG